MSGYKGWYFAGRLPRYAHRISITINRADDWQAYEDSINENDTLSKFQYSYLEHRWNWPQIKLKAAGI